MKHLKTYNESVYLDRLLPHISKEIINGINDILLELDLCNLTAVNTSYRFGGGEQNIFNIILKSIKHGKMVNDKFEIDAAADVISRLIDFMKQNKFSTKVEIDQMSQLQGYPKLVDATHFFDGTMDFENISGMKFTGVVLTFSDDRVKPKKSEIKSFHDFDERTGSFS